MSDRAVDAAMEVLLCKRDPNFNRCRVHEFRTWESGWTERGCPVAVEAADAARPHHQAQALRDAADEFEEFAGVDYERVKQLNPKTVRLNVAAGLRFRAERLETP